MKRPLPKGAVVHSDKGMEVFKGVRFSVYQWQQKIFNGEMRTYETIKRNASVIVIPVVGNEVVIVKERQAHIPEPYLGFPAGGTEDSEDLYEAARRELEEETGMICKNLDLVSVHQYIQGVEWFGYTFIASGYEKTVTTNFDEGEEDIEIQRVSFEELVELTKKGAFMYPPRFIEKHLIENSVDVLFDTFRNPSKYRIE